MIWPRCTARSARSRPSGGGHTKTGPSCRSASPLQLQDATRQLAVSAQALVDAGPGQPPEVAFWLARRLSALRNDISVAQALTREAGIGVGDAALWDHLGEPLRRAGNRLLLLIVQLARIKEWSLSGPDGELSEPDQAVLVIQLG